MKYIMALLRFKLWKKIAKRFLFVLAAIVTGFLVWEIYRDLSPNVVYVDTFDLPQEDILRGLSPHYFTDRVVSAAQSLVEDRRSKTTRIITYDERRKKVIKEQNECLLRSDPLPSLREKLNEMIKSRAVADWRRTDLAVSQVGMSVRTISDALRRAFGKPVLQLSGAIVKVDSNRYVVQIHSQFGPDISHESEVGAKTFADAEKMTSMLILKYANPAMYASIVNLNDPNEVEEALSILPEHWVKPHSPSLPFTYMGYLLLNDQNLAEEKLNKRRAKEYFRLALENNESDDFAKIGLIAIKDRDTREELKELEAFGSNGPLAAYAFAVKAMLHRDVGEFAEEADSWKKATTAMPIDKSYNYIFLRALSLIDHKKFEKAERVINQIAPSAWQFQLGHAMLTAEIKSPSAGDSEVEANITFWEPCAIADWAVYLQDRTAKEKDEKLVPLIRKLANDRFAQAEHLGVSGFNFYNRWGVLLFDIGRDDKAIEKYQKARDFYGSEAWTLHNIGMVLLRQNRLKEAEASFRESLGKGPIPIAADKYLGVIFNQKDYRSFLDEYNIWGSKVPYKSNEKFQIAAGIAHCSIGEREAAKAILQRLVNTQVNEEHKLMYDFLRTCVARQKSPLLH